MAVDSRWMVMILLGWALARPCGAEQPDATGPLPPDEATRTMVLPDGFQVTLFAGEPDVRQPIGFCIDDRGRLWIAEAYGYPHHSDQPGKDRILILEDSTGDGRHDKRTVFYEGLNYVTGIEVGFGGAWVMSPPFFYFIADQDRDDVPDGPPEVLLDGFGTHANAHNLANGFAWGPDGWLYGTHGRTNWSLIGKPGAGEDERKRFDGGVWRYHPRRHVWEPYADGTTNPWGIDWNDYGQAFVCNCVNPHLFQVIQGAHYEPWRNRESSRYAYERVATIADHLHYLGVDHHHDDSEEEQAAGGGHAHCGTMIYLGDNWPQPYRNTIFMNNIHGKRINNDIPRRSGSGYIASHGQDLMVARDPGFMGITLAYGPDGGVFASDWSDTGACHTVKNTQRETGRIFKVTYGRPARVNVDMAELSTEQLVKLQLHRNDWWVRHARRVLQERFARGEDMTEAHRLLKQMYADEHRVPRKLRALWTLHVTGGLENAFLLRVLDEDSEYLRAWSIQLLCEDRDPPLEALQWFCRLAESGSSPLVRLYLASALGRLEPESAWPIAEALVRRGEDHEDPNLPLMIWYGLEPLVEDDLERFVQLAVTAEIPLIRRHVARRVASLEDSGEGLKGLAGLLAEGADSTGRHDADVLEGILRGLQGRRAVPRPTHWRDAYARLMESGDEQLREQTIRLALIFDDPVALRMLQAQAVDASAPARQRRQAIDALAAKKVDGFARLLIELLRDDATRQAALQGLAVYDHPATAPAILNIYSELNQQERQQALQTLSTRAGWASSLLDAIAAEQIPRTDLTAYTARQLRNLGDEEILDRVNSLWGHVRETPAEKAKLSENYKRRLTEDLLENSDLAAGRQIFQQHCANCHRLFGQGGKVGPDITGSNRLNLDYLLENLIDPSASVARDYQMEVIQTSDGRVVTGLVTETTPAALTVVTVNEQVVIPRDEIHARKSSSASLMPDGLLNQLSLQQVRDLIGYLRSPRQVRLPQTEATSGPE